MTKGVKRIFLIISLFFLFANIYGIEFGGYLFNEYNLGEYKDIGFSSVGVGFNIDWQPLTKLPLGIGARLQWNYTFAQNENIEAHWNAGALSSVWWRFYLGKGFMLKPTVEYGLWLSSIKANNQVETKTFFAADSVLQFILPLEWTNRRFVFSVAPLYTMIFQQTAVLNQIGFRIGFSYTTKDLLYNNQASGKYSNVLADNMNDSLQNSPTKLWMDIPQKIVVSPKVNTPIVLEIRPEQLEGEVFSVKWKVDNGSGWQVIEGQNDLCLSVTSHLTGRFWYCAEITDSKGNITNSSVTQILVHRDIGEYYKDSKTGQEGIICDVTQDGKPALLLSLEQTENLSLENANEWCKKIGDGWTLPTFEQLYSIIVNQEVINETLKSMNKKEIEGRYWSTTNYPQNSEYIWQWYDIGRLGLEKTEGKTLKAIAVTNPTK